MERIVQRFLDKMEKLDDVIDKDVDSIVDAIDIDAIIVNPLTELTGVVDLLKKSLEDKVHPGAVEAGIKMAQDIERFAT